VKNPIFLEIGLMLVQYHPLIPSLFKEGAGGGGKLVLSLVYFLYKNQ
jgi:hypothetical protein